MDLNAVMSAIVTDLRANISDPISDSRENAQWVHRGAISPTNKTPSVFIEPRPTDEKFEPVGGASEGYIGVNVHCVMKGKKVGESPLDSQLKTDDDELLDDIVQSIKNRMDGRHYGDGVCCFNSMSGEFPIDNFKRANTVRFTVTQG